MSEAYVSKGGQTVDKPSYTPEAVAAMLLIEHDEGWGTGFDEGYYKGYMRTQGNA